MRTAWHKAITPLFVGLMAVLLVNLLGSLLRELSRLVSFSDIAQPAINLAAVLFGAVLFITAIGMLIRRYAPNLHLLLLRSSGPTFGSELPWRASGATIRRIAIVVV